MAESSKFGDYVLLERIGDGGMAEIFRASRRGFSGFEKQLALKRILPRYSGNETFVRMLIHEAKLAAQLQHTNIVQVIDLGAIEGQVFLVMEFVRGRDLAGILSRAYRRKEKLPVPLALCIATEFLTGLDYAHRKRSEDDTPLSIIHRDISPQNILISFEGEVKVTDFGIARIIAEKSELSLPGNMHGKFGYMSPEQVRGKEIDQRSDIFSAGVVIWEMLTGRRLFRGSNPEETIDQVANRIIEAPSSINPEVPPELDDVCLEALERDRSARFQTVGALLGACARIAESVDLRAAPRDVSVYMRRHFGAGLIERDGQPQRERTYSSATDSGFISAKNRPLLGELLRRGGEITTQDLQLALAEQRARGGRIGEILINLELSDEEGVCRGLANQLGLEMLSADELAELPPPEKLTTAFPREAAERTWCLPLQSSVEGERVRVITCEPLVRTAIMEVELILQVSRVELRLVTRSAFVETMLRWYAEAEAAAPTAPLVLVADARADDVAELVETLKNEELEVELVEDGRAARRSLVERSPSAAIFDAALPRIDGINLLLEAKAAAPERPVFITSRRSDDAHHARALEMGADDVFVKPLAIGAVAAKIRRAAGRAPAPKNSGAQILSGALESMTAVDLIQSLEIGGKTATIELQYEDGRSGSLELDEGHIQACRVPGWGAEEGFNRLMVPGPGRFRVQYGAALGRPNLDRPNTHLLMEAMRCIDEARLAAGGGEEHSPPPLREDLIGDLGLTPTPTR
ncbi:MAG: protein kinase [Myxococcota bacterium]